MEWTPAIVRTHFQGKSVRVLGHGLQWVGGSGRRRLWVGAPGFANEQQVQKPLFKFSHCSWHPVSQHPVTSGNHC